MKLFYTVLFTIVFVSIVGFALNMVRLLNCDFEAPYKAEAIRITGIFVPPVGIVAGFFDIED